ncbi:MAG: NFACT RNA binding domain-containing protein, partial [Candidatus Bipolaricaulota bacterium]
RQGEIFLQWREGRTDALRGGTPRPATFHEGGVLSEGIGPELRRAAQAVGLPPEEFAQRLLEAPAAGYIYETPRGMTACFFPREDLGEPVEEKATFWEALDQMLERRLVNPTAQWIRDRLRVARERRKRALKGLEEGRAEAERWPDIQSRADLILARLSDIPHGESEVTVEGFDGSPVRLPLDPKVPPVVHAQALYRRARKLRRRLQHLPRRRRALERELHKLDELAHSLSERPDLAPYLEEELLRLGEGKQPQTRSSRQTPKQSPREIYVEGFPVQVGRSARENEALVRRARDEDLWLHARGVPGAHVLVSTGGRPVPPEVLQRAAELAAWHSQARGERKVQVSYTESRYLRKPKGATPGTVKLLRENVLRVPGDRGP